MKKVTYPPLLMLLATVIATVANKLFGVSVDIEMAAGALAVVGNYLAIQFAVDMQAIRRGELPKTKFNSVKFYTAVFVSIALGLCNYFKIDIGEDTIKIWVGMGMTIITLKGVVDLKQNKKEAATNAADTDTNDYTGIDAEKESAV